MGVAVGEGLCGAIVVGQTKQNGTYVWSEWDLCLVRMGLMSGQKGTYVWTEGDLCLVRKKIMESLAKR